MGVCTFESTKLPSGIAVNPAHVEFPSRRRGLPSAHITSVDIMASLDHDERLRGALATTLIVFLTYEKRRRARTLIEWAIILDVLEDIVCSIHGDGGGRSERGWRWSPRQAYSASPPTIGFLQMVFIMLRKPELKQCDSREYSNFCRHLHVPYEFLLELVQL